MPGFGVITSGGSQVFGVGSGSKAATGVFNESNESWQDYIRFMETHHGWKGTMPESIRGQLYQTGTDVLQNEEYKQSKDDVAYADKIITLTDTIVGLDAETKAKHGKDVDILGSKSGVSLVVSNIGHLIESWTGIDLPWVDDPVADTSEVPSGTINALTNPQSRQMISIAQSGAIEFSKIDFEPGSTGEKLQSEFSSALATNLAELGANPTDVEQARIMTNVMGLALATLMARLFSRNDRLLKQQYQDFRDLMELDDLFTSDPRAMARIKSFGALAAMFRGMSSDKLAGFEQQMAPSEWLREEWGGYSDKLAAARRLADQ